MTTYQLSHLRALESESIHIIREVAAEFERPGMLFSGGKDSLLRPRLAAKAFWPGQLPFPVMHVDTGHNFPEVLDFRDRRVAEAGAKLVIASVQDAIDNGLVTEETGPRAAHDRQRPRARGAPPRAPPEPPPAPPPADPQRAARLRRLLGWRPPG